MNEGWEQGWRARVERWIGWQPTTNHRGGLARMIEELGRELRAIDFEVELAQSDVEGEQPVIVGRRAPRGGTRWIGLLSHYDVEIVGDDEVWQTDPWQLSERDGRLYGRGIGDNLGPLALRLLALGSLRRDVGVLWLIQGEEEVGSPWAHRLYPRLDTSHVELWLEETGYFYEDGAQRVLTMGDDARLTGIVQRLQDLNQAQGRETRVRRRFLNKAFGQHRCPGLLHLVRERPYLAIGPNDDGSRIHGPDESLDPQLLGPSMAHLHALFEEIAR
jgi:hypothetical protein